VEKFVYFFNPPLNRSIQNMSCTSFFSISITGDKCALNCKHCSKKLIAPFKRDHYSPQTLLNKISNLYQKGLKSVLLTGGANIHGRVDFSEYYEAIKCIKRKFKINVIVHTGLIDDDTALNLKNAGVDIAMIDIIGSDDTIKKIYNLNKTVKDYELSLKSLESAGLDTVPHILIGLNYGEIIGEFNAIDIISKFKIKALVFIVLRPTLSKFMKNVTPPDLKKVKELFQYARTKLNSVPLLLGCQRPYGTYREKLDILAIDEGIAGIAHPSKAAIQYLKEKNYRYKLITNCCSSIFNYL